MKRGSEIEKPKGKENFPRKLIIKSAWSEVKAAGRRGVLWIKLQQRLVPECLAYRREIFIKPTPIIRRCRARPHLSCRSDEKYEKPEISHYEPRQDRPEFAPHFHPFV